MRKGYFKVLAFLLCLITFYNVKAASLSIECNDDDKEVGDTFTCNLNLEYENEIVKNVSFSYTSDYTIAFTENNITNQDSSVLISFDTPLSSTTSAKTKIGTMNITASEELALGNHNIALSTIKYLNGDEEEVDILDVNEEIEILAKPEDCRLSSITINNNPVANFSSDTYAYDIEVSTQSVSIDVVKIGDKVTVVGLGTIRVKEGKIVSREIVVSDLRNNSKTYTLNIKNVGSSVTTLPDPPAKSGDNTIKSLEIWYDGNKLDFVYDASKTSFLYTVRDNTIDKIEFRAVLNDNKATFDDLYCPKEYELDFGLNKFEILVIAENQDLKVYSLNIVREDLRDKNNNLKSITVGDHEIELTEDKYYYEISSSKYKSIDDILAVANSSKAKISYREITLPDGASEIDITVTAENGEEQDYNVIVNPIDESDIEGIVIKDYSLAFDKDVYSYEITLKNDEKSLDITILPNELAYEITGNKNLDDGSVIKIKYKYQGVAKEYTINIKKEAKGLPAIVCYIVFIVGLGTFTFSIIYYLKKTKK